MKLYRREIRIYKIDMDPHTGGSPSPVTGWLPEGAYHGWSLRENYPIRYVEKQRFVEVKGDEVEKWLSKSSLYEQT